MFEINIDKVSLELYNNVVLKDIDKVDGDYELNNIKSILNSIIEENNGYLVMSIYDKNGTFFKEMTITEVIFEDNMNFEFNDYFMKNYKFGEKFLVLKYAISDIEYKRNSHFHLILNQEIIKKDLIK